MLYQPQFQQLNGMQPQFWHLLSHGAYILSYQIADGAKLRYTVWKIDLLKNEVYLPYHSLSAGMREKHDFLNVATKNATFWASILFENIK